MATNEIAGRPFHRIDGVIEAPRWVLEDITTPWKHGNAFRAMAKRGPPFELIARRDFLTDSAITTAILDYQTTIGTLVTIKMFNNSHTNFIVLDVTEVETRVPFARAVGGITPIAGSTCWVATFRWVLQHGALPSV